MLSYVGEEEIGNEKVSCFGIFAAFLTIAILFGEYESDDVGQEVYFEREWCLADWVAEDGGDGSATEGTGGGALSPLHGAL